MRRLYSVMPAKLKHLLFASLLLSLSLYSMYSVYKIVILNLKLHTIARQLAYTESPLNGVMTGAEIIKQIPDPYSKLALQRAIKNEFLAEKFRISSDKIAENGRQKFRVKVNIAETQESRVSISYPLLKTANSTN